MGPQIAQIVGQLDALTIKSGQVSNSLKGIDMPAIDPIEVPEIEIPPVNTEPTENTFKKLALRIGGILGTIKGATALVGLSDEFTAIEARINRIKSDNETVRDIQNQIFESAQRSRAEYSMTADIVGRLGSQAGAAFTDTSEIIAFSEQLNKTFALDGTEQSGIESVMYNLTQAMATGVLRGQDLNAVMSNTPSILKNVADYLEVDIGFIRDLAAEGELSAEVVKNAMLSSAAETNAAFEEVPQTFAQIKTAAMNEFIFELQPALSRLNEFFNTDIFQNFVGFASAGLGRIAELIAWTTEAFITGVTFAAEAMEYLQIPLLAIIGLVGIYQGIVLAKAAAEMISGFATSIMEVGLLKATAAQLGLNTAILTSPIFIIPAVLITIIAIIFGVVTAINNLQGTTISALGIITGAINVAIEFVINILKGLWNFTIQTVQAIINGFISAAEFIANVFINPIGAVNRLFYDLGIFVLETLSGVARIIDTVFGSNLVDSINGWTNSLQNSRVQVEGEFVEIPRADMTDMLAERRSYSESFDAGYQTGANAQTTISDFIGNFLPSAEDLKAVTVDQTALDIPEFDGELAAGGADKDKKGVGSTKDDLKDLKKSTKSIDKAVNGEIEFKNEDLTYLREAATARAIQNFSFDKVVVEVKNDFGDIHQEADLEGWIDGINEGLTTALETIGTTATEGGLA